jgi:hypothetical protein
MTGFNHVDSGGVISKKCVLSALPKHYP